LPSMMMPMWWGTLVISGGSSILPSIESVWVVTDECSPPSDGHNLCVFFFDDFIDALDVLIG